MEGRVSYKAVSYTHLDVYKRQIFGSPGDSPIFLSVSSIPFPARIRKPYLCKQTKGLSMLQLKRNDLLIGFTRSVLLSIFVNFALLMRKYEFETGNPSMGIQPPDRTMYYLLIWFFVFSFILFIVNSLMYKFGDKLFRRKEYKRVLVVCVTCISIAYGMFHLSPVLYTAIAVSYTHLDVYKRQISVGKCSPLNCVSL